MLRSISYGSLSSKAYWSSPFPREASRRRGNYGPIRGHNQLQQPRRFASNFSPRPSLLPPPASFASPACALCPRTTHQNNAFQRSARCALRQYSQGCYQQEAAAAARGGYLSDQRSSIGGGGGGFGFLPDRRCGAGSAAPPRGFSFSSSSSATSASLDMYMWGTDTKGSLLKPHDRRDESIVDVPQLIQDVPWKNRGGEEEGGQLLDRVVCGASDTAFVLKDGTCYVVGENKYGQLGLGHKDPVSAPTPLKLPPPPGAKEGEATGSSRRIADVALGSSFAAVVDADGYLYTSGFGGSVVSGMGMLGHGTAESIASFRLVQSLVDDECRVRQVQVGESHMTVLTTEGEVLTCGAGSYGRLGNFDTADQLYLEPVEVLTPDHGVVQISSGKSFTLALTRDGTVYGWGRNHRGQLGVGLGLAVDMYAMQNIPEPLDSSDELANRRVARVSAGSNHAACIAAGSGELFYWGMGLHLEPVRVDALLHTKIVDVACGREYTIAVDEDGRAYSWGKGKAGCLGQGGSIRQLHRPARMEAFGDDQSVVQVSAGWTHAACLVAKNSS